MKKLAMVRWLRWRVSQSAVRHHLVTVICLMACVLMMYRATVLRTEIESLEASVTDTAAMQEDTASARHLPQDETDQLMAFFPAGDVTEPFLKKTYASSTKAGVNITNVSIEPGTTELPGLRKNLIRMTLASDNDSYRPLIHDLLKTTPYLSLLRMSISRNDQGTFMADLTWGVYSR